MSEGELDVSTLDGVLALAEELLVKTQEVFLETQDILPMFFVLTKKDPDTMEALDNWAVLPVAVQGEFDPAGKEQVSHKMRAFCHKLDAVGIFLVSEVWSIKAGPDSVSQEAFHKEAEDWIQRFGDLSDFPGRVDTVMLTLEHKEAGHRAWVAEVTNVGGRRIMGKFEALNQDGKKGSGRFSNLLNT